ncbi:TetR/AcrR family transcriptional regulator [bacterium]|nr:TetR/AcrR family transcriptional regulator [bacterium]
MSHSHQAKRDQLVEAILEILLNEGPSGVGAIAVARKLKLAPSAPYAYFTGRGEMINAALQKIHTMTLGELGAAERNSPTPLDALRSFTLASAGLIPYISVIPRLLLEGTDDARKWLAVMRPRETEIHTMLARLLAEAQTAEQIRADITPAKLARYYLGLGYQVFGSWSRREDPVDLQHEAEALWRLFESAATDRTKQPAEQPEDEEFA